VLNARMARDAGGPLLHACLAVLTLVDVAMTMPRPCALQNGWEPNITRM
jgi:hypothetical protein